MSILDSKKWLLFFTLLSAVIVIIFAINVYEYYSLSDKTEVVNIWPTTVWLMIIASIIGVLIFSVLALVFVYLMFRNPIKLKKDVKALKKYTSNSGGFFNKVTETLEGDIKILPDNNGKDIVYYRIWRKYWINEDGVEFVCNWDSGCKPTDEFSTIEEILKKADFDTVKETVRKLKAKGIPVSRVEKTVRKYQTNNPSIIE